MFRTLTARLARRRQGRELRRRMRGLGHVVGLDHVEDPHQLRYAETTSRSSLGQGDLEGLAILGAGPCG